MLGLSYTVSGDPRRQAILFLHGFMGSGADWAEGILALDERFYCVAPDLPGHGASLEMSPERYTIEGATRALLGLLDDLDIERAALVGYSMGGRLALYLALHHPERCSGLFLESGSPGIESEAEREARRRSDKEKVARLQSGDLEDFLDDWYWQPIFASLARDEDRLRTTIEARLRNDPTELARSLCGMGTGQQPSLWSELGALRVPALAVAGELDKKYVAVAHRMGSINPLVRAAVVTGAGHSVRLEAPEAYLALLERFLDSP